MKAVIKRDIKNYLKNPILWIGMLVILIQVYQILAPYLSIHYMSRDEKNTKVVKVVSDADIMDGYVPASKEQRRRLWEEQIYKSLQKDLMLSNADEVMNQIKDMDLKGACLYLEEQYRYYGAMNSYELTEFRKGSREEINQYLQEQFENHPFSFYFARKYTDFAGLYMGFFAVIMLAFLFVQDTKKNTYELLHTKPIESWKYVLAKILSGFLLMLGVLLLLTLIFMVLCGITAKRSGFPMNPLDFIYNIILYVLPNMLMICCVYAAAATVFKTPLPAVPILVLFMTYSNMLKNIEGVYYAPPLSIMVRFPGRFFETVLPYRIHFNQLFLIAASMLLLLLVCYIWKRRRVY